VQSGGLGRATVRERLKPRRTAAAGWSTGRAEYHYAMRRVHPEQRESHARPQLRYSAPTPPSAALHHPTGSCSNYHSVRSKSTHGYRTCTRAAAPQRSTRSHQSPLRRPRGSRCTGPQGRAPSPGVHRPSSIARPAAAAAQSPRTDCPTRR
jgi:hypothetical protein